MRSISNFLASLALLLVSKLGNDPATGFTTVSRYNDRAMAPIPTVTSVNSKPHFKSSLPASISPLFHHPRQPNEKYNGISSYDKKLQQQQQRTQRSIASKLLQRIPKPQFDTLAAANLEHALTAGLFGSALQRVKKLHDPKTYLVLGLLSGLKWDWCFKSPYFWFAMGFCIKWYRARYVYKIPVWDRQPNWNNVITSKEQEKDLKAFTCKNCGSTIFIAKTREFFFEGSTGIGGLGCFTCGAKGKDNFVMDRDRIVEDVADEDDYFDYERPLDFVSRAERRKLLKEAKGDEEVANRILAERTTGMSSDQSDDATASSDDNGESNDGEVNMVLDAEIDEEQVVEDVDDVVEESEGVIEQVEENEPEVQEPPKKEFKRPTDKKKENDEDDFDLDSL